MSLSSLNINSFALKPFKGLQRIYGHYVFRERSLNYIWLYKFKNRVPEHYKNPKRQHLELCTPTKQNPEGRYYESPKRHTYSREHTLCVYLCINIKYRQPLRKTNKLIANYYKF